MDSCSVKSVGCWWRGTVREYEGDGVSGAGTGWSVRGKEGNWRVSLMLTDGVEVGVAIGFIG